MATATHSAQRRVPGHVITATGVSRGRCRGRGQNRIDGASSHAANLNTSRACAVSGRRRATIDGRPGVSLFPRVLDRSDRSLVALGSLEGRQRPLVALQDVVAVAALGDELEVHLLVGDRARKQLAPVVPDLALVRLGFGQRVRRSRHRGEDGRRRRAGARALEGLIRLDVPYRDMPFGSAVSSPTVIGLRPTHVGGPSRTKTIPRSVRLPRVSSWANRESANATRRSNSMRASFSASRDAGRAPSRTP